MQTELRHVSLSWLIQVILLLLLGGWRFRHKPFPFNTSFDIPVAAEDLSVLVWLRIMILPLEVARQTIEILTMLPAFEDFFRAEGKGAGFIAPRDPAAFCMLKITN
ncbi:protein of unknown function [Pseudorhizobium banfieldiae]|uniref:Uncharacterized protein n=1 Tax=Pseudorhizobium banfieldiae TaxID=1125847 RepID=L0NC40_9HYPH|nr:protein of unknown function [Pseudorhizobium banfieldiae]